MRAKRIGKGNTATSGGVGARLDGTDIAEISAKFDLVAALQPAAAVMNFIDIVDIAKQAGRSSETCISGNIDSRNAICFPRAGNPDLPLNTRMRDPFLIDRVARSAKAELVDLGCAQRSRPSECDEFGI